MERTFNFSAGPGTLPESALEEAREEMLVYKDAGASVMEISHRSRQYTELAETTRRHIRDLLGIGDEWHILFLQGGASLQFYQAPLNFLTEGGQADYIVTGRWSAKALKEARGIGHARNAASSEEDNFTYIPETGTWDLAENAAFVHITSNNTIVGTQFASDPVVDAPLVCDASSDFMSRPIDMSGYGLIYAGAQKNIGPAGVTVVLIRDDFLEKAKAGLPTLLDYRTHTAKLFHTPPVFAVYMVEKVLRWLKDLGGLPAMQKRNEQKASKLYTVIDASDFYTGTAHGKSRSRMNVTYRLPNEDLEAKFVAEAAEHGLMSLKGHRSVGGIRASIYNACPPEAVDALVSFMEEFERKNG
jgi:phosphoserine aminotransferase